MKKARKGHPGAARALAENPDATRDIYAERHRTSSPPKVAKVHTPDTSSASAPRAASGKTNPPPLLDREKEQLFQQFLEWRKRQTDVP